MVTYVIHHFSNFFIFFNNYKSILNKYKIEKKKKNFGFDKSVPEEIKLLRSIKLINS